MDGIIRWNEVVSSTRGFCPQQERKKADSSGKFRPRNDKSVGSSATRRRRRSMLRHYKCSGSVFGPAEGNEGVVETREGQADNVEVAAFDARDVAAGAALDGVAAGFVVGRAGGEGTARFFGGERGEMDQRRLDEAEPPS